MMDKSVLQLSLLELVVVALLALAVGSFLYFLRDILRRLQLMKDLKRVRSRSIRSETYGRGIPQIGGTKDVSERESKQAGVPGLVALESITIKNFKNITQLKLDFMRPSRLTGEWTCIAGINGAGKTSILQAICLVLLGKDHVSDLGRGRLGRMLRRTGNGTADAEIEAIVRQDGRRTRLYVPLMRLGEGTTEIEGGLDVDTLRQQPDFAEMVDTWAKLRKQVFACFGASRNVSEKDPGRSDIGRTVQRQMSLFDPLTQLASAEVLLKGGEQARPVLQTLYRLIRIVLDSKALKPKPSVEGDKLRFSMYDASMDIIDLPDGFRSTVAWLSELCSDWHERNQKTGGSDPSAITGIVLLDEIGLHLHPSLEKALVPQLRKALPRVQFIVTTHSPMVLSSFDRDELIILDSDSRSGTRELDRQVFGLTMDDVYAWLMNTSPGSPVMQELLEEGGDPEVTLFLYQSKDVNEELARKIVADRQQQIAELQRRRDDL